MLRQIKVLIEFEPLLYSYQLEPQFLRSLKAGLDVLGKGFRNQKLQISESFLVVQ